MPFVSAGRITRVIVMANDGISAEPKLVAEPRNEFDERFIGFIGEFTRFVRMAAFDGDGGVVAVCSDSPCDLVKGHTLNDLALKSDDEMGAGVRFVVFKVAPVLVGGGAGIARIMNDDIFQLRQLFTRTGIGVNGQITDLDQLFHRFVADVVAVYDRRRCRGFRGLRSVRRYGRRGICNDLSHRFLRGDLDGNGIACRGVALRGFRRGWNGTCLCGGVGGSGFDIVQKSHIMDGQNDDKKNEKMKKNFIRLHKKLSVLVSC